MIMHTIEIASTNAKIRQHPTAIPALSPMSKPGVEMNPCVLYQALITHVQNYEIIFRVNT